jgi:peroxiredoxin
MALLQTPVCAFGTTAPNFRLLNIDGKYYELQDCSLQNGLLVMFICNHCPYVKAILSRLIDDVKTLQAANIGCVAICSNNSKEYPEDSYKNMQKIAKDLNFSFPYLVDETQTVAKAYGAVCTPDFFGYNSNLKLQYRGRLDASGINPAPADAKRELVEAMMLVAKTGKGPMDQVASQGCSIKWNS